VCRAGKRKLPRSPKRKGNRGGNGKAWMDWINHIRKLRGDNEETFLYSCSEVNIVFEGTVSGNVPRGFHLSLALIWGGERSGKREGFGDGGRGGLSK